MMIMPTIYIKKELYVEVVRKGYEINEFVEDAVREKLRGTKEAIGECK